ncbi:hypothetical protein M2254_001324 [Chryseobacterium sp. BIGb0186]|nr:hypothetical protein [Chryseobacterium sp. JUb44]MDH6209740.1 hypothetical protein [Chryseobacterium sp. BIGb0186]
MTFPRIFKINIHQKAQISTIKIMYFPIEKIGILKFSDEQIASNRRNKSVFLRSRIAKIKVFFVFEN